MRVLVVCLAVFLVAEASIEKRNAYNRQSLQPYHPLKRQAWKCHPGCKKFCLPSCKRSCCLPNAPNYTPGQFPELMQYQASMTAPPPLPQACPPSCNPTCYPSCDAGCCAANSGSPQASPAYQPPPAYPGYQAPSPYDPYGQYSNPAGCAPECAPANTPECCRSQALQLNIRPALSANPAPTEKPEPTTRPSPPTQKQADKPKISKLKAAKQIRPGTLCLRKCQKLCHSKCKFVCCLPTHKHFDDDPKPVKKLKPTYYRKKPRVPSSDKASPTPQKTKSDYYVRPVAGPQPVRFPSFAAATRAPSQFQPQPQTDSCGGPDQDPCGNEDPDPTANPFGATTDPFPTDDYQQPTGSSYVSQAPSATQAAQGVCPAACPSSCAPACTPQCCEETPAQPMFFAPPPPPFFLPTMLFGNPTEPRHVGSPGLSPLGQQSTCPGTCSSACAPVCSPICCGGQVVAASRTQAPIAVHVPPAVPQHPAPPPAVPQHVGSPGFSVPLTCSVGCPSMCAPSCTPACCAGRPSSPGLHHPLPDHPRGTCMEPTCPNSCFPSCTSRCCSGASLPANWDKRNSLWRYKTSRM
ncbi:vegetative cell wall protein gp1 [Nematostella vectensis]|uniref:vegetative cell wall protein gp1 n=1 Tax=Nematostella vectensis TaxID=45351 RepID=UPI0020777F9F|nr:vegetative cell wall protein gp1 [Nematostella vectensis]